jgi:hypothetical protein
VFFSLLLRFCASIYTFQFGQGSQEQHLQPEGFFFIFYLAPLLACVAHTRHWIGSRVQWLPLIGATGFAAKFATTAYTKVLLFAVGFAATFLLLFLQLTTSV